MKGSMYEYMKVGTVHFKAYPEVINGTGPILETLEKIAEDDFFTAIELGWIKDMQTRLEAAQLLKTANLEVVYATQPAMFSQKLNLNTFDEKDRQRAIKQVKNCIEEACHLGATAIRIPAGKDPGDAKREDAKKLLIDSFRVICEYAKEWGNPMITLKIFDRDIDKESLIGYADDALDVAKVLREEFPRFGLLTDLSHFPLLREKPEETLPKLKEYVTAFQIGNCVMNNKLNPLYGDLQPRFGVENGEVSIEDVAKYFRILLDLDLISKEKRPVVSAEVRPLLPGERSNVVMANVKRAFREGWALA